MSRKVALLIGVSEYGEGIPSLSAPINDVAAVKRVLKNPEMGGFDEVETLINPDLVAMQTAIQQIFSHLAKDDLVLLFFSGHGFADDNNRLYFATKGTSKNLYKATSVSASFVQDISSESYAKRQVIVLDCCYSGAFAEGWQAKSIGLDLKKELGAEGRVVLTSSTATTISFEQENAKLSLYTQYLVEGIETGAADKDGDGKIYAHELHDYAKGKVKEVKPRQEPGIIIFHRGEGYKILLSQAPVNDPELVFRQLAKKYAAEGKGQFTSPHNYLLTVKAQQLQISDEQCKKIINEVLAPYMTYKKLFRETVDQNYSYDYLSTKQSSLSSSIGNLIGKVFNRKSLNEKFRKELQVLQNTLGLEDKDVAEIEEQILAEKKAEYQQKAKQKEQQEYENRLKEKESKLQQQESEIKLKEKESKLQQQESEIKLREWDLTRNILLLNDTEKPWCRILYYFLIWCTILAMLERDWEAIPGLLFFLVVVWVVVTLKYE